VTIYDLSGRIVKKLSNNQTVSVKGFFTWDGTDETGLKVRPGYYLVVTNMFSVTGKKFSFKNKVVVASSLD
jgi:flagellar hook assembly protein FlgD